MNCFVKLESQAFPVHPDTPDFPVARKKQDLRAKMGRFRTKNPFYAQKHNTYAQIFQFALNSQNLTTFDKIK